ncbi:HD domain-containing phosphohydrolase [Paucidesulfovibrio longus]|uniref:HD domain-containing phosphohydrolase n=1 Tax=Paucidesulfovibrio longus TaxID=889 RepID=UPI0003B61F64|nr:HD domain-containing phosphohydrolase [Paucidesulfovibrio longus]
MRRIELPKLSVSSMLAGLVLGSAGLLVAALLTIMIVESRSTSLKSAQVLFTEIAGKTVLDTALALDSVSTLTDTASLAFSAFAEEPTHEAMRRDTPALKALLESNEQLMSAYIGYGDGAFHQLIAIRGNAFLLKKYAAPEHCAYIDRTIAPGEGSGRSQAWRFLDSSLAELSTRTDDAVTYDPRSRPWFAKARESRNSAFTTPYVFSSSRLPGITCAKAFPGGVIGVDVALAQLGELLARQHVAEHGRIWIFDERNRLVAFPGQGREEAYGDEAELPLAGDVADPVIRAVSARFDSEDISKPRQFYLDVEGEPHLVSLTPTDARYGLRFVVGVAAPLKDITGHISRMTRRIALASAACLLLLTPAFLLVSRLASRSVEALVRQAERVANFDFSPSPPLRTPVREVRQLAEACEAMKQTIRDRTERLHQTQERLELLVREGVALSAEKDLATLVTLIFETARDLTGADGGALYLMENDELGVEMLSLGSESVVLGGLSGHPAPRVMVRPAIMAFLNANSVLRSACEAYNAKDMITIREADLKLFPTGLPEEPTGHAIHSLIAAPIVTRQDEVLGVVQLFNPTCLATGHDCGEVADFVSSLTAQAAVTLDNRNLLNSLRDIFDALIQVIATSIDAKSPYTAGHCARVPVLAGMLADAANETEDGPLAAFHLDSEEDRRQLWIASWLHDCGKVTTPEYVVDKATKLETIYNRIHEVRMRFEVLRRDAEIAHLRRLLDGGSEPVDSLRRLEETLRELEEEFAFVAKCNIGGEFLSEEHERRLEAIAGRTWQRHFSDRLGISSEEQRARSGKEEPPLPATERLLSDQPEHLVPRHKNYKDILDATGHPVETPQYEYNRGELYNLRIQRGTLTAEERFKINEHTLSGMEMLQKIPFPANLGRVVEIATEHHETLIGTGYPLHKRKENLSVESRILAIADIFEALTASDRPYKQPKRLSEALRIMSFMCKDKHIDADLFEIFLRKGVFRQYAEQHLAPEQIDDIQVEDYLGRKD